MIAVLAALTIVVMMSLGAPDAAHPGGIAPRVALPFSSHAPAGAAIGGSVTSLQTRFAGPSLIEIWGRTSGPDGTSISLRLKSANASPVALPDAPAVAGSFYTRASIPSELRGRPMSVSARVVQ